MSSIFSNFFRFFSEFFSDLIDRLFALAAFTGQLDYLITSAYVVSSVFRNFFRLFSDFFLTVLKLFRLPFRTGQLAYSIIPPRRSQSFFTHFFAFFCFFLSFFSRFAGRTSCCVFTQYMVQYIRFYTSPGEKDANPSNCFLYSCLPVRDRGGHCGRLLAQSGRRTVPAARRRSLRRRHVFRKIVRERKRGTRGTKKPPRLHEPARRKRQPR